MNHRLLTSHSYLATCSVEEDCQGEQIVHEHTSRRSVAKGQSAKRQTNETSEIDLPPAKRTRLARTESSELADQEAEQAGCVIVQQPNPRHPKHRFAPLLEDVLDQSHSNPALRKYCPESVDSLVTDWVDTLSLSDIYRERHCRSDIFLDSSGIESIPRRLTKSTPNMQSARDAHRFVVPPTPPRTRSSDQMRTVAQCDSQTDSRRSFCADSVATDITSSERSSVRSSTRLVEKPLYRSMNLAANNIYLRSRHEQIPESIARLVDQVRRERDSPGPCLDEIAQDMSLENLEMGTGESDVGEYFKNKMFPKPDPLDSLKRVDTNPMAKQTVPNAGSALKVSTPVPDILYGYGRHAAFAEQRTQLISMGDQMVANSQDLIYPFFVIEFTADGPSRSTGLWVATNQCLGGSASCVHIAERVNCQLRQCKSDEVQPITSAAFSVAMSGTEARLYISWKNNELDYYTRKVKSFLLQEPEHYVEFRKYVLNILDWGKDKRLNEIRDSLSRLLEESKKQDLR